MLALPADTARLPVVTVRPVPAVIVVVAAKEVVVVREPGAVIAEGKDQVTVDPEAAVVIWLAVPARVTTPAEGTAVPESAAKEVTLPAEAAKRVHVEPVLWIYQEPVDSFWTICPKGRFDLDGTPVLANGTGARV